LGQGSPDPSGPFLPGEESRGKALDRKKNLFAGGISTSKGRKGESLFKSKRRNLEEEDSKPETSSSGQNKPGTGTGKKPDVRKAA